MSLNFANILNERIEIGRIMPTGLRGEQCGIGDGVLDKGDEGVNVLRRRAEDFLVFDTRVVVLVFVP